MEHGHHIAEFSYGLAFMTGLLGSGHCLGMCGGLVSSFFMRLGAKAYAPYLAYHAARVTVYTLIGLAAASLGAVLVQTGIIGKAQGILQIVAGLVVILLGLEILIIADIIQTITVDLTLENAATLGVIVLVRTFLSFSLEVELEGAPPWRRLELARAIGAVFPDRPEAHPRDDQAR